MKEPCNDAERVAFAFFGALGAGDFEKARPLRDDAMCWTILGTGVPGAGTHVGPDAIFSMMAPIRALFEPGSPVITLTRLTSDNNTVVMETHGGGRFMDGRPYDNRYVMSLDVKNGKIAALREYMDTHYVNGLGLPGTP